MKDTLIMGSRKSILAMVQTEYVRSLLLPLSECTIDIKGIMTEGDQRLDQQLANIGGKGLFLKEVDKAMLDNVIDLSVHSLKDVPVEVEPGLVMAAIPPREEVADVFISNKFSSLDKLPENSVVGTSSLRRQCLISHYYPKLKVVPIRGNIHTRLKKLDDHEYDALILAKAGLNRTKLSHRITKELNIRQFVPAIGQGALAVYCRENDENLINLLSKIDDRNTRLCVSVERSISEALDGGCHMPLAANTEINGDTININAMIGMPNGDNFIAVSHRANKSDYLAAAKHVADELKQHGAEEIINALR